MVSQIALSLTLAVFIGNMLVGVSFETTFKRTLVWYVAFYLFALVGEIMYLHIKLALKKVKEEEEMENPGSETESEEIVRMKAKAISELFNS